MRVRGDFPSVLKDGRLACILAQQSYARVYSHHHYQRCLEYIAQIARQLERNYVSLFQLATFQWELVRNTDDVHRSAARSTACVDEERLLLLICLEWLRDPDARMRFASSDTYGASGPWVARTSQVKHRQSTSFRIARLTSRNLFSY